MQYGLKIYSRNGQETLKSFENLINFDFIEVLVEPDTDFSYLKDYKKDYINYNYIIHAPHIYFGVNIANPERKDENAKKISNAIKAAMILNAEFIIIHPGSLENEKCSLANALNFIEYIQELIQEVKDTKEAETKKESKTKSEIKFVIENLFPHPSFKKQNLCYTLDDIKFFKKNKIDFCLDIGHASMTAKYLGLDYLEFIQELIKLKPIYFHFCDCKLDEYKDHLHFGDGDLDIKRIKRMLPQNAKISIETKIDERLKSDFEFLAKA